MSTFKNGPSVDTDVKACAGCKRPMMSRNAWAGLDDSRRPGFVAHGAAGLCRGCDSRKRWSARPIEQRNRGGRQAAAKRTRLDEASYWREEWEHLRKFGVSPEEAAVRLGISVSTIQRHGAA